MRYQKDKKIDVYRAIGGQDDGGAWHTLGYELVGRFWAYVADVHLESERVTAGILEAADIAVTVNKSPELRTGLLLIFRDGVYEVTRCEEFDAGTRGDMRLYCKRTTTSPGKIWDSAGDYGTVH